MIARAQLVAVVPALSSSTDAYPPSLTGQNGHRALAQRTDRELIVCPVDDSFATQAAAIRFPAPWPRRRGTWAVSPDLTMAVFAGVHALRAVDSSGRQQWELRHRCWEGACLAVHDSHEEYADRPDHQYPKSGSAAFSGDGRLLWAHVPGLVPGDGPNADIFEKWLVLSPEDGQVLARAEADAASEGSQHLPHPADPGQMGLSIGEGQDGAPVRWGRWDGKNLSVDYVDDDVALLSVSPAGEWIMSVSHDQDTLTIRRTYGSPSADSLELDCATVIDEADAYWDWAGGFISETTVICSTDESDWRRGNEGRRHWLIDNTGSRPATQVIYPSPVSNRPTAIGDGIWSTTSEAGDALNIWVLEPTPTS